MKTLKARIWCHQCYGTVGWSVQRYQKLLLHLMDFWLLLKRNGIPYLKSKYTWSEVSQVRAGGWILYECRGVWNCWDVYRHGFRVYCRWYPLGELVNYVCGMMLGVCILEVGVADVSRHTPDIIRLGIYKVPPRRKETRLVLTVSCVWRRVRLYPFILYFFIQRHLSGIGRNPLADKIG